MQTQRSASSATQPASTPVVAPVALTADAAEQAWRRALEEIGGVIADMGGSYESVAVSAPNSLVVNLKAAYNKQWCERQEVKRKIDEVMSRLMGQTIRVGFTAPDEETPRRVDRRQAAQARWQKMRAAEQNPLVREAIELFEAEVIGVDEKRDRRGS